MTRSVLGLGLAAAVALAASCSTPSRGRADVSPSAQPDLNGTWGHQTVFGIDFVRPERRGDGTVCVGGCTPQPETGGDTDPPTDFPKYKTEFLAKVADLNERQVRADTVLRCYPPGVPRIGPPAKIVQTARQVVFLYDDPNGSFFRIIPTDGRPRRTGLSTSYLGDAIGRFEGDTLVVETTNFTDETWLTDNGAFHTMDLKVIERLRRIGPTIEYQAVADDPAVLAEPWVLRPRVLRLSAQELEEPPRCEERDLRHMVDGSHHENPR
jgi:hypothetical protein